jgi:hypothetical protein
MLNEKPEAVRVLLFIIFLVLFVGDIREGSAVHEKFLPFDEHFDPKFGTIARSEPKVAIAYIILVDDETTANGASFIIRRLYHEKHLFVVHFDKRNYEKITHLQHIVLKCCQNYKPSNILFLGDNFVVQGGISVVQAELDCLNAALKAKEWDFAINLSGYCYPIQRVDEIEKRLDTLRGKNVMHECGITSENDSLSHERLSQVCWESNTFQIKCYNNITRPFAQNIELRHGSQWWILTREFVRFVLRDNFSRRLLIYMTNFFHPAEVYFQTLLWNSEFRGTGIYSPRPEKDIFRYEKNAEFFLDTMDAVAAIKTNALFARKLLPFSVDVYKTIDEVIYEQKHSALIFNPFISFPDYCNNH